MDKIVPAFLLAAVSGITFLAYNHPHAYRKLLPTLLIFCFVVMAGSLGWNICASETFSTMAPHIKYDDLNAASKELHEMQVPWWVDALAGLSLGYFAFLEALPRLIEKKPVEKKTDAE